MEKSQSEGYGTMTKKIESSIKIIAKAGISHSKKIDMYKKLKIFMTSRSSFYSLQTMMKL
jgi:hypothetical protein